MDPQSAYTLFEKFDDPVSAEHPPGFDRAAAAERFKAFVAALHDAGVRTSKIEYGLGIQDATFHAEVRLDGGLLRFSNYGDMVALAPDNTVDTETIGVLMKLTEQLGFHLIPTEVAETSYTGRNPGVRGIDTWWIRYFDYL